MATGDRVRKSFASDAAVYALSEYGRQVSAADALVPASWPVERKAAVKPTAQRLDVSAADTTADLTDAAYGTAVDVGDSPFVAVMVDSTVAVSSVTVFLILFSEADTLLGVSESITFTMNAVFRDGVAGKYLAPSAEIATRGAAKVKAVLQSITGTAPHFDIFIKPL
jgi:hypothetical protein